MIEAHRMIRRPGRLAFPLAPTLATLILSVAACDAGSGGASGPTVRDSAGVQIVENSEYAWTEGRSWRLADEPLLDIGLLDGDPEYQLFRVGSAVRLDDGRIVVANSGTHELRVYDPNGAHLISVGREGGGPGEFGELMWVRALPGDTLLTYDWRNRRLSFFDAAGDFVRSFQLQFLSEMGGFPTIIAPFGDGSLLVGVQPFLIGEEIKDGLRRDTTVYLHCDRDGAVRDTLGRFPGGEVYLRTSGGAEIHVMASARAFGRFAQHAVYENGFYFSTSDSYEVGFYSSAGQLVRIVRRNQPNLQVTAEDIERYKEERLENAGGDGTTRDFVEQSLAHMPFPETYPAHGSLVVDAVGNLWVEGYRRPGDERPRWTVFDSTGRMLGVVETPERFTIHQIGSDFVLGRWADDVDVEHVRLYELIKE
ncbi:MAG: hypothetical protein JSU87_16430 [Gemmatimonadota bacterium]|nr:MAG: hypothetical protein JSU87_16430 [Gemmatimonadota bacterium]